MSDLSTTSSWMSDALWSNSTAAADEIEAALISPNIFEAMIVIIGRSCLPFVLKNEWIACVKMGFDDWRASAMRASTRSSSGAKRLRMSFNAVIISFKMV